MTGLPDANRELIFSIIVMKNLKGFRLYVSVSAAQARRRLKGHGFGVRKIESAGKGRALIIHTATGNHLHDLEMLFTDALCPPEQPTDDETER